MDFNNKLFGNNLSSKDSFNFRAEDRFKIPVGSKGLMDQFGNLAGTHRTFDTPSGIVHIVRGLNNIETAHTISKSIPGSSHGGYFVPDSNYMTHPNISSQPLNVPSYLNDGFNK